MLKRQWLHIEQGCQLPPDICSYAARGGSIDLLRWLKEHGTAFTAETCEGAAAGAHIHVLQYLRDEGCEWGEYICCPAASNGHLSTLQWLRERGCPWSADYISICAASSGSTEMLIYLKQQGCVFNANTMRSAAVEGHLPVYSHLDTLCWLREQGCPWNIRAVRVAAAQSDRLPIVQYMLEIAPAACATQLTLMLCAACAYQRLSVVDWLQEQGAEWPEELRDDHSSTACHNYLRVRSIIIYHYFSLYAKLVQSGSDSQAIAWIVLHQHAIVPSLHHFAFFEAHCYTCIL
jgi:hypothetical protein